MNKLISLNEVRNEKSKSQLLMLDRIQNEKVYKESYITFKEKFNLFRDNAELNDLSNEKIENKKSMIRIVDRIFLLNNDMLIINFINSIYDDRLNINTKIKCIKNNQVLSSKNSNYNIKIIAEDEYRNFEYKIQFEISDYKNLAIMISKKNLTNNNIVSFSKKKEEFEKDSSTSNNLKEYYDKCIIVLNSDVEVPDLYEYKSNFNEKSRQYKINIIKSWKYDFKLLFERKMYLLFPLKVIDLKKRLLDINIEPVSKKLIRDEILIFFNDMNRYLKRIKSADLIIDREVNNINLIAIDLLNTLINDKNNIFLDLKMNIQATLKDIVV